VWVYHTEFDLNGSSSLDIVIWGQMDGQDRYGGLRALEVGFLKNNAAGKDQLRMGNWGFGDPRSLLALIRD
jgi:hypothetical protein